MSRPVRVLIADDQGLVREGLMTLLGTQDGIDPIASAADGEEAVALCDRHLPDVVLMDLRMPRLDGVEATRRIRAAHPQIEVVVLTTYADDASIMGALLAGARGYLTKDAGAAEIARAVQAAAAGQTMLDPRRTEGAAGGRGGRAPGAGERAGGPAGRAHPARGRGAAPDRQRIVERRDRLSAGDQRGDRQDPRQPSVRQDRRAGPRPGGPLRLSARPRRLTRRL
jgi:DNA-binding NarL/FixJ family response regulator